MRKALNLAYGTGRSLTLIRKFIIYLLVYGWNKDKIRTQMSYLCRRDLKPEVIDEFLRTTTAYEKDRDEVLNSLWITDRDLAERIQQATISKDESSLRYLKDLKGAFNAIKGNLSETVIIHCFEQILDVLQAEAIANSRRGLSAKKGGTDPAVNLLIRVVSDILYKGS